MVVLFFAAAVVLSGAGVGWRAVTVSSGGAPPIPRVRSAQDLGPLRQHPRVNGRDDGQSARYGDWSVWVFGDTVVRQPWGFLSNTGAATSDLHADDGITLTASDVFGNAGPAPVTLLPLTPAEQAFTAAHDIGTGCTPVTDRYCGARFGLWPGAIVADPARHRLLVLYGKLCRGGGQGTPCSGSLGLALGTGIAAIAMDTHRVTRLSATGAPVLPAEHLSAAPDQGGFCRLNPAERGWPGWLLRLVRG